MHLELLKDMLILFSSTNKGTTNYKYLITKLTAVTRRKKLSILSSSLMHCQSHMVKWSKPQPKIAKDLDDSSKTFLHLIKPPNLSNKNFRLTCSCCKLSDLFPSPTLLEKSKIAKQEKCKKSQHKPSLNSERERWLHRPQYLLSLIGWEGLFNVLQIQDFENLGIVHLHPHSALQFILS